MRYLNGHGVDEIGKARSITPDTVLVHLARAIEAGEPLDVSHLLPFRAREEIREAFARLADEKLKPVFEALRGRYSNGRLKLYLATRNKKREAPSAHPDVSKD